MRKSRHLIVVNWYLVFASFAQAWGKNSQTKADHNIRELEASNCTQEQKHTQIITKGQQKGTTIDTFNAVKKKLLEKWRK